MVETKEIAVFKADIKPVRGRTVFWLLSKSQIELLLQDVSVQAVPFAQRYLKGIAAWQGLALPVINLEEYFDFKAARGTQPKRRLLVRVAVNGERGDKYLTRMLIDVPDDFRIRPLGTDFAPVPVAKGLLMERGFKGAYEWEKDKLVLVPDLAEIAAGGRKQG